LDAKLSPARLDFFEHKHSWSEAGSVPYYELPAQIRQKKISKNILTLKSLALKFVEMANWQKNI
jgi:hypothetical protein